jgi:hypothetical protein
MLHSLWGCGVIFVRVYKCWGKGLYELVILSVRCIKIKQNPNWFCNPEGVSGYPEDSEVYKSGEKGNKSKWPQKFQETKKTKVFLPSGVANFVYG